MAWTNENRNEAIELILDCIASGQSLKSIIDSRSRNEVPAYSTFMLWLDEDSSLSDKYARACEERELYLLDQIFKIADDSSQDEIVTDNGVIPKGEYMQRSRLRVDVRKWALSKMNPKKYGDKVDHTTGGEKLPTNTTNLAITLPNGKTIDDFKVD